MQENQKIAIEDWSPSARMLRAQKITVNAKLPNRVSDDERSLLEKLATYYSARGPQHHHHKSGLFSRLFRQLD